MSYPEKIKILFHLNQLGYGGTEKAILTFCENLDRQRFIPCLYVYDKSKWIKKKLVWLSSFLSAKQKRKYQKKYVAPWARLERFQTVLGADKLFIGGLQTLASAVESVKPDIIHFNRGNWDGFFAQAIEKIPARVTCVETNIFGKPCDDSYLKRLSTVYFVSHWLLNKSPWHAGKGKVLYNPIKSPVSVENLRAILDIPANAFVLGRISRPDMIDDTFVLEVFDKLHKPDTYLIVLAATESIKEHARRNSHIKLIDATTNERILSQFYNSLDVLLHRRIDGETFGMNIAEAMIHGKPVISHFSHVDNAQAELLHAGQNQAVGFVARENDQAEYLGYIQKLYADKPLAKQMGNNAEQRANALYQEQVVTRFLENEYLNLLAQGDAPRNRVGNEVK